MSFFINNRNQNKPGPLNGSPINGLCEKALVEVCRIFDACIIKCNDTGIILRLAGFNPPNPALPLTFISAECSSDPVTVTNVVIDRVESAPNFANVSCDVNIPIVVTYRDANGVLGAARSMITLAESVILFVPQAALSPIEIKAQVMFSGTSGTFRDDGVFVVNACAQIILKVISKVDMLVPSYGYPVLPPNQTNSAATCNGMFDLPLYPTADY